MNTLAFIFILLDMIAATFVLIQGIRHYKLFGYLPLYLIIGVSSSTWIGLLCFLALFQILKGLTFFILVQIPFLILLSAPGIVIYSRIKEILNERDKNILVR